MAYWFKVPGYSNIYASRNGEILKKYKKVQRIVSQYTRKRQPGCGFFCKINNKEVQVAHLVYKAFYGAKPEGTCISHKDGYKWNNSIDNLEAISLKELGRRTGAKCSHRVVLKIDQQGKVIKKYNSAREAAKFEAMSRQTITDRCNGKVKKEFALTGYSFRWREK